MVAFWSSESEKEESHTPYEADSQVETRQR